LLHIFDSVYSPLFLLDEGGEHAAAIIDGLLDIGWSQIG